MKCLMKKILWDYPFFVNFINIEDLEDLQEVVIIKIKINLINIIRIMKTKLNLDLNLDVKIRYLIQLMEMINLCLFIHSIQN